MATHADIQVNLAGVHLCCQGCTDAVNNAIMSVDGIHSRCDMEHGTVTFTAYDASAARKALAALAAAGFYGTSDDPQLKMVPVNDVPRGKVHRLIVSSIHNCCDLCFEAIQEAIATVEGVSGDTAEPRATKFEVTGDFSAAALVEAINAAGFSARIES